MGPVLAGYCKMESIYDGSLDLEAFALLNEAMEVKAINEHRIAAKRAQK